MQKREVDDYDHEPEGLEAFLGHEQHTSRENEKKPEGQQYTICHDDTVVCAACLATRVLKRQVIIAKKLTFINPSLVCYLVSQYIRNNTIMSDEKHVAFFPGRFQPFHNGHLLVVEGMTKVCSKIIIGIGSSNKPKDEDNPYSVQERKDMIQRALQAQDLIPVFDINLVEIPDFEEDADWAAHCISDVGPFDKVWTGNEHTKKCFEDKGVDFQWIKEVPGISGEEIREAIKTGGEWDRKVPPEVVNVIEGK